MDWTGLNISIRKVIFYQILFFLMSAVLLLLYVTLMPFAPILVDRTAVSARLDTVAMEKLAKVGENTLFII